MARAGPAGVEFAAKTVTIAPAVHLVEPDSGVAGALRGLFAGHGLPVRLYGSAEEFLATGMPARGCVVTEVELPGQSGIDLIEALRRRASTVAVVVIAARGDVATAVRAMRAGAADFLEKPFAQNLLFDRVLELIGTTGPGRGVAAR